VRGLIAGALVVAWCGVLRAQEGSDPDAVVGRVSGEPVTRAELAATGQNDEEYAFRTLALYRAALRAGIEISPEQVIEVLQQDVRWRLARIGAEEALAAAERERGELSSQEREELFRAELVRLLAAPTEGDPELTAEDLRRVAQEMGISLAQLVERTRTRMVVEAYTDALRAEVSEVPDAALEAWLAERSEPPSDDELQAMRADLLPLVRSEHAEARVLDVLCEAKGITPVVVDHVLGLRGTGRAEVLVVRTPRLGSASESWLVERALERVADAMAELERGRPWEEVARALSDLPEYPALDWVTRGDLLRVVGPEVAGAVFEAPLGDLVVVSAAYAVHLVQPLEEDERGRRWARHLVVYHDTFLDGLPQDLIRADDDQARAVMEQAVAAATPDELETWAAGAGQEWSRLWLPRLTPLELALEEQPGELGWEVGDRLPPAIELTGPDGPRWHQLATEWRYLDGRALPRAWHIELDSQKALEEVRTELAGRIKDGAAWEDLLEGFAWLAQARSVAPTADLGGSLGVLAETSGEDPALLRAVVETACGERSGVVEGESDYFLVWVLALQEPTPQEARDAVRRALLDATAWR
jgi:hypothetical protein